MKITEKHKMSDYVGLKSLIELDKDFIEKLRKISVPKQINGVNLRDKNMIQLQHIIQTWNMKEEQLLPLTAKSFGLDKDKIFEYPLIDFMRLVIELQDVAIESGRLFSSLSRKAKNEKLQSIFDQFKESSNVEFIDRFVLRSNGAYTHEQAAETGWYIVYEAFKADTKKYDIDVLISEIKN